MRRAARVGFYVGFLLVAPVVVALAAGIILASAEALIRFVLEVGR
jgi:hypothetical protein